MTRRIDIELTSRRDDGSWTWRAPGARQPRGEVDGSLLPGGARVGDVLRADAEFELDGIVVTGVLPPKADGRSERAGRIEVLGSGPGTGGGVSVTLAPGRRRLRDDEERPRRGRRPEDGADTGRPPRTRPPHPSARTRPDGRTGGEDSTGGRRSTGGRGSPRVGRTGRPPRAESVADAETHPVQGPGRRAGRAPDRQGERPERVAAATGARDRGARSRRIQPPATHRNAALADLRPEELPVAEQLLRGGIPALRQAIEEQNARALAEGRPPVSPEPLLAMAEALLPKMNLAAWMDRATAVQTEGRDAPLREVRSVVAGATAVALDHEGRALLSALRASLETRVTALRQAWLGRITGALDEHRVADALRVASSPPEPAARIPADLAVRLSGDAGAAMSPELPESDWLELLEAVVTSPVRRTVKPAGLPPQSSGELLTTARRSAGHVPELARLLGLPIPPPPGPRRPTIAAARRG